MLFVLPEEQGIGRRPRRCSSPECCREPDAGPSHLGDRAPTAPSRSRTALYSRSASCPGMPRLQPRRRCPPAGARCRRLPAGVTRGRPSRSIASRPAGRRRPPRADGDRSTPSTASSSATRTRRTTLPARRRAAAGFLYRDADGPSLGYGYASPGRPDRARRASATRTLLAPVIGHLLRRGPPRRALRASGSRARADGPWRRSSGRPAASRASRRSLCWDRPFADFARYLPISPGSC